MSFWNRTLKCWEINSRITEMFILHAEKSVNTWSQNTDKKVDESKSCHLGLRWWDSEKIQQPLCFHKHDCTYIFEYKFSRPMAKMISESTHKRWKPFLSSSRWVTRTYFPRAHMSHALNIVKKNSAALFATSWNKTWWFVGFNSLTVAAAAASSPCWLGVGLTGTSTGCPSW